VVTTSTNDAPSSDSHRVGVAGRRRAKASAVTVAVGAVLLDQVTKTIAVSVLATGPAHVGILHLRLVANRGIFMGMIALPIWLITSLTLAIVAWATSAGWRNTTRPSSIAYALLSAGALGNLIDRYLLRPDFPPNAVVDWLSFGGMTFNLADVFLMTAVLLLIGLEPPLPNTVSDALT